MVARRGAEAGGEVRREEGVGGDSDESTVDAASLHALIGLDVAGQSLHHHLRRLARVLHAPVVVPVVLQHAPLPRRRDRKRTQIRR